MSAEKTYRIASGGAELGSMTLGQLRAQWNGGVLDDGAYYFDEAANDWLPVESLIGPRAAAAAPPRRPAMAAGTPAAPSLIVPTRKARFSNPILASIFNILGGLAVAAGIIIGLLGAGSAAAQSAPGGAFLATAFAAGVCIFQGILLIGAGQVIGYIGRIAFHTERAADLLAARG